MKKFLVLGQQVIRDPLEIPVYAESEEEALRLVQQMYINFEVDRVDEYEDGLSEGLHE